jgi:hypothetical protein
VVAIEGGHCVSRSHHFSSRFVRSDGFLEQSVDFPSFAPSLNSVSIEKFKEKKKEKGNVV